ncbi:efflux RND transporter periplasmic adaptor subunit [Rubrivivax rivuli]|uniref:Efflux RND transporter periplasmic adaptor subunit n=1 Tax=Rubrivivax rivuli TaxID=1862385 RepID=A0A437RCV9_9BURK|nr:efflux RND transporter periplasmic adaptor subunit [Rubrivivax rivuli]RVU44583.1 efflux RND transporter periplasmic adaptor subunit [Rubrivivax rivuli]
MSRRAWVLGAAVALLAAAAAVIGVKRPAGTAPAAASAAAKAASAPAMLLAAGDVARADRAELGTLLQLSGGLRAVDSAMVKAKVAAEVRQLNVREGDRVQAGQLLGRLDATEVQLRLRQAQDNVAAAQAQVDTAQRSFENNRALVGQGFISRNALDTSANTLAGAQASLQAARAAADLAKKAVADTEIRAPIGGLVAQRLVQPGERIAIDGRLVEIVDLGRIELEAAVAPEDVLHLRVGQAARVFIDGLPEPVAARVARINPSAVTGTRSVLAYLALAPTEGLRQGLFARATVQMQSRTALVVPASAVRDDQARPYVLAVEGGLAVARTVKLGARGEVLLAGQRENAVEVLEGLAPGTVVLRGTVGALRAGTRVQLPAPAASANATR